MYTLEDVNDLWIFLKKRSNEIRSNEIRIRREPSVLIEVWMIFVLTWFL